MASANDNNAMPPLATVAPLVQAATQRGGEGYAMQHSSQNWSQAAVAVNMTTPISRMINVENHASATSLLTALHAASIASAAAMPSALDSFTLFPSSSSLDEDVPPSPKRDNLSDFNRKNLMMTWLHLVTIQPPGKRRTNE
jgi:hypothetical protein